MAKRTLVLASLVLALGVAAVSGAYAAGMTTPNANFTAIDRDVVAVRFCPISILCIKGKVPRCHYSTYRHRCVCTCVPRHHGY
jgi:hypothetical protein